MKRKLIHGLLAAAALLLGAGSLSSCKDTDQDQFNDLKYQNLTLQDKVTTLEGKVNDLTNLINQCQQNCKTRMDALEALINQYKQLCDQRDDALQQGIDANSVEIQRLNGLINGLQETINTMAQDIADNKTAIENIQNFINNFNNVILPVINSNTDRIDALETLVNNYIQQLTVTLGEITNNITTLQTTVAGLQGQIDTINGTLGNLTDKVNGLETTLNNLQQTVTNLQNNLQGQIDDLKDRVQALETAIDAIRDNADKGAAAYAWLGTMMDEYENLAALVEYLKTVVPTVDLTALEQRVSTIETKLDQFETRFSELQGDVDANTAAIAELVANSATKQELQEAVDALNQSLDALTARVNQNAADILALQQDVQALREDFNNRMNELASAMTGIIVQDVENPIFGSLKTPFGLNSNAMVMFYGWASYTGNFPEFDSSLLSYDGKIGMTAADASVLRNVYNKPVETISLHQAEYLMSDAANNAGTVYVTVNPANVDFTGMQLSMVTSQDNESGMKLSTLRRSDKELNFGLGRAAENGFYEADVKLDPNKADIDKCLLDIEPGLKAAVKEALKDRSKASLTALLRLVALQMKDVAPAYGLKAAYDFDGGVRNIISNYDLLNAALHPLSFVTFYGRGFDNPLPDVSPYLDLDLADILNKLEFHFDSSDIHVNVEFHFSHIEFNEQGKVVLPEGSIVNVYDEDGNLIGTADLSGMEVDATDLIQSIADTLNGEVDIWNEEISTQLNQAIADAINEALTSLEGQVNDHIADIVNGIYDRMGTFADKFHTLLEHYNALYEKISHFLAAPNNYLQSLCLYESGNGSVHRLSNVKDMPTVFNMAGGDVVKVYATTYTAETVCPVYKKFVAVTDVINNANPAETAKNGNSSCLNKLVAANRAYENNCKVVDGMFNLRFFFGVDQASAGYTYEVTYSALDYHGITSTRKYYFTVK